MTAPTWTPHSLSRLRTDLSEAGWTHSAVMDSLSSTAAAALDLDDPVPASLEMAEMDCPPCLLTRLFMLGEPLTAGQITQVLPSLTLGGATEMGLLVKDAQDDRWRAAVDLRPHQATISLATSQGGSEQVEANWWVAADLPPTRTGLPPAEDHVLGVTQATRNLAYQTIRRPVENALDLGTGNGLLALYLSLHANRVVATDVSQRAADFTRFNAALNRIDIDVRTGSLFAPVEGEQFDLITSNPPFVITPPGVEGKLTYRDGGKEDSFLQVLVQEIPQHLQPGGTAQLLANWPIYGHAQHWQDQPQKWLQGLPLHAWVALRDTVDVATYTKWWLEDARGGIKTTQNHDYPTTYRNWLAGYAQAGITHIGLGSLTLQKRRSQIHWPQQAGPQQTGPQQAGPQHAQTGEDSQIVLCEDLTDANAPDGEATLRALQHLRLDPKWQEKTFVRAGDVREERYYIPGQPDPQLLRLTQGIPGGRPQRVSPSVSAFVGVCEGELTPAQVLPVIADLLGEEESQVTREIRQVLPELLRSGVLEIVV